MKTLNTHVGWICLFTVGAFGGPAWAQGKAADEVALAGQQAPIVFCPAITREEQRKGYFGEEPVLPVDLVVLGTSKEIEEKEGQRQYEVDVQKVLYGSVSGESLRFTYSSKAAETEPTIFALALADYDEGYKLVLRMAGDELKFQERLSSARLDFNVLASCCIFIGKQAEPGRTFLNSVEVVRSLHGPVLTPGERLTVYTHSKIGTRDYLPPPQDKEVIYLVHTISSGKEARFLPKEFADKTVYQLNTRLRTDQEQAVKEAWERRDEYPISMVESKGEQVPAREIVLRGPLSEAIEMMGALGFRSSDAAVLLASRTLLARKQEAIPLIAAAIERDLIRQTPEDARTFVRLQRLVFLLAEMDENHPGGETDRLIGKWLTAIPTGPSMAPWPKRDPHRSQPEEKRTDVNHTLTWLVESMDRKTLDDAFCARLLEARDSLQGGWRQEVQLALDAASIEDTLELMEALSLPKKGTPLSIRKSFLPMGGELAYSQDGKLLAVGNTLWNVADWSKVGSIKGGGSLRFFSPDSKFLYALGGGDSSANFRYNWRTGQSEVVFTEHQKRITSASVSTDGKVLLTVSYSDYTMKLWELPDCKLIRSYDLIESYDFGLLCPDGKWLVRQTGKEELIAESLVNGKTVMIKLREGHALRQSVFTPDGKLLMVATEDFKQTHIQLYNVEQNFEPMNTRGFEKISLDHVAVSRDSRQLVTMKEGVGKVLSLPDLQWIKEFNTDDRGASTMAFSPQSDCLAVGSIYNELRLFDATTFARIPPPSGHGTRVTELSFSADGKTLCSSATDGTVCRWNALTGEMESRILVPEGYQAISSSKDGRYLVCYETKVMAKANAERKELTHAAKIIDFITGAVVSEPLLPVEQFDKTRIIWMDDHRAIASASTACVFNYLTGEIIQSVKQASGHLTENGQNFFLIKGDDRMPWASKSMTLTQVNLPTGEVTELGKRELKRPTGGQSGLIPGGRYFYIGHPGMFIYDLQTMELVAEKTFKGSEFLRTVFSPDGSRYVVLTSGRLFFNGQFPDHDAEKHGIIRLHDTLSGKLLWAALPPSRRMSDPVFSPDGQRLGSVADDGTILVWDVEE